MILWVQLINTLSLIEVVTLQCGYVMALLCSCIQWSLVWIIGSPQHWIETHNSVRLVPYNSAGPALEETGPILPRGSVRCWSSCGVSKVHWSRSSQERECPAAMVSLLQVLAGVEKIPSV